ncbi:MAG: hypothetical protein GW946_02730 [Candidatus Pacebacteria bacterium]|nr:hypothetical protein [Candidatus Paceibacterota bacterium]PIR60544.1 MAG: hypothetical protein COU67_02095 [Candidatus Pacebacteria bacterium CG10_big_fil_rev_8_21_14_0_10_44_54]
MKFTEYFSPQLVKKNFLAMSWLLKVLFVLNIYSFVTSILALYNIQQKEVVLSYFGSGFPQNLPSLWHIYSILFAFFGVYVFMNRSRSLLVKYTIFSAVTWAVALANQLYSVGDMLNQPNALSPTFYYSFYIVLYAVTSLLIIYPLTQKKYFHQK